jgi:hypothetical protein
MEDMGGIQLKETIPKGEIRPTFSLYKITEKQVCCRNLLMELFE